MHDEHHGKGADEDRAQPDHFHDVVEDEAAHRVHVAGRTLHHLSGRHLVVTGKRQAQDVREHRVPHPLDGLLGGGCGQAARRELRRGPAERDHPVDRGEQPEYGHQVLSRDARKQGIDDRCDRAGLPDVALPLHGQDNSVHGHLNDLRFQHPDHGCQDEQHAGHGIGAPPGSRRRTDGACPPSSPGAFLLILRVVVCGLRHRFVVCRCSVIVGSSACFRGFFGSIVPIGPIQKKAASSARGLLYQDPENG